MLRRAASMSQVQVSGLMRAIKNARQKEAS